MTDEERDRARLWDELMELVRILASADVVMGDSAQRLSPDANFRLSPAVWLSIDTRTTIAARKIVERARNVITQADTLGNENLPVQRAPKVIEDFVHELMYGAPTKDDEK